MQLLKNFVNIAAGAVTHIIRPQKPNSVPGLILEASFNKIYAAMYREAGVGSRHDNKYRTSDDYNFTRLVMATENILLYIAEHDRYYKRWLGLALLLFAEETQRSLHAFSFDAALESSPRPLGLTYPQFVCEKEALWLNACCGYLYALGETPVNFREVLEAAHSRTKKAKVPIARSRMAYSLLWEPDQKPIRREEPHYLVQGDEK